MRFVRLPAIPLTVSGKVDRESLPDPGLSALSSRPPQGPFEGPLLELFRDVLSVPALGVEDDFFDWGGDSLKAVALMMKIDEAMGVRLSAAVLLNAPAVALLAPLVARGNASEVEATWLRREGDLPPLVCLPGLAGDPMWFMPLLQALDSRRPVLGLSFVGLNPPMAIAAAADKGVDALMSVQPRGPYLLLGHSLGGVLAFEMARRLQSRAQEVSFVGLIDTFVPGAPRRNPTSRAHRFRRWRNRMFASMRNRLGPLLTRLGASAPARRSMFIPGLKFAAQSHRIAPGDLAVTLFRANERSALNDLPGDWRPLALRGVEVIDIPGHHFDLISGGRARELSARVAESIRRKTT
jgi:thioesterase domain-containing protein/acyl carrier protein